MSRFQNTQPLNLRERDTVPIVQKDGWAPGPVWTGEENLALIGINVPYTELKHATGYTYINSL
jgi:hypothetical protein